MLSSMYDIYAKSVDSIASNIVAIYTRYEDFALMIINEETTDHFADLNPMR